MNTTPHDAERRVRIFGMGRYLPKRKITGEMLDLQIGVAPGTTTRVAGVATRYYVDDETNSTMGAYACMAALEDAHLAFEDVDAIICASGTVEQAIPCTAALIQRALGKQTSGVPCLDINSTCLSFVAGLDLVSYLISAGRYRKVLLVASEIASAGLNWKEIESCSLFGDGAVAMVLGAAQDGDQSKIVCSGMATYSAGAETSVIRGGGTRFHPREFGDQEELFLFSMDGRKLVRQALELVPGVCESVLSRGGLAWDDIDMVVPHQASAAALEMVRRRLKVRTERWMCIVRDFGNMIAASVPLAFHEAVVQGKIARGDRVMLLGMSAGFSIGVVVLEY